MSIRQNTPCDCDGICPYVDSSDYVNCEYWCGADEPEDVPEEYLEEDEINEL